MSRAELQARIDAIRWYHEIDFPDGLKSRSLADDVAGHRRIWRFIEAQLADIDFHDKTVLDVGAWDGYWSFYAERRGARSVLATDDLAQNWSDGQGILLAKDLLKSRVEIRQNLSVHDLSSLQETFDIIMCFGVYYHLVDPFHALAQIRHCCHSGSLLLLEGNLTPSAWVAQVHLRFGDSAACTIPSAAALDGMLQSAFFRLQSRNWLNLDLGRPRWRARLLQTMDRLFIAARSWTPFRAFPVLDVIDRAFTVCAPVFGPNPLYHYPPPFGLERYDDRFHDPQYPETRTG